MPVRVVLVDDEAASRLLFARALTQAGYTVLEASNGKEAWQLIEAASDPVQLVITDVIMPQMDGHQLGRLVAKHLPAVPVLYVSAYETGDIFQRAGPRSAPFLQKPFGIETLLTTVAALLAGRDLEPA